MWSTASCCKPFPVFSQAAVQHFFFCHCPLSCNYLPCPSTRWSSLTMGPVQSWGSNHWGPREMKLFTNATLPILRARLRPPPDSAYSEVSENESLVIRIILQWIWQGILSIIQSLQRNYVPRAVCRNRAKIVCLPPHSTQIFTAQFLAWQNEPIAGKCKAPLRALLALARVH